MNAQLPNDYRAYALRYRAAADVQPALGQILSAQGVDARLVLDAQHNQILVHGAEPAQTAAAQYIASLDKPVNAPATNPAPPPAEAVPAKPVLRAYPCPKGRLDELVERLRSRYAANPAVRIAGDPQVPQILVLATDSVHRDVVTELQSPSAAAAAAANSASPGNLPAGLPQLSPGSVPPINRPGTPAAGSPTQAVVPASQERFVSLGRVGADAVEATLRQLLGERLAPARPRQPDRNEYLFQDSSGDRLEIGFDRRRGGVGIFGPVALADQFERLVRSLDQPATAPGAVLRVVPIRRADLNQVRTAVEAYRAGAQGGPPPLSGSRLPGATSPAFDESSGQFQNGGIKLVSYLFQDAAGTSAAAPNGPPGPPADESQTLPGQPLTRPGEQVEIETLPDLDVIILRGPQRDVDELSRIIDELERLSAETVPAIEIYQLRHVQGTALSALITQVNSELIGGRQGRVSVTPLVKPNALLLIGWGEAVSAVKELISRLDQPVAPESQFRLFPLRHAAAMLTAATLQRMFASRGGLAPIVLVTPDMRTNSLIVQAPPRDLVEVEALIAELDVAESASVAQARVFKLQNSLANDLAATLQRAILSARGGTTSQKSSMIELLDLDAEGKKLIRSGILDDVDITPDPRTNTVLVSAPADSMELVAALIEQLDSPSAVAQIKVFRVVNGDANAMALVLRNLFPSLAAGVPGPQLPGSEGETTLVPLRFSVDLRTNSIIATGSAGDLAIVEALLLRLDSEDVVQRQNQVYRLKNAPALDVATAINEFLRSERQVSLSAPGTVSPFQQIEAEVVVVPEPVSNALIISATPRFYTEIMDLVEQLDAQPPQVMIQVLIAEVDLNDANEFGIEVGLQDSVLFDRSILGDLVTVDTTTQESGQPRITTQEVVSATNTPGYLFNSQPGNQSLGNSGSRRSLATADIIGTQGITNLALGRMNSELGFGGLVLSASSDAVSVLLRALQQCQKLEVLSRPQVMTLDNQPAFIQVGKRVPRIVGSAVTAQGGLVNDVTLENVGLILGVTPRISPDGRVVMEIDAEKSALGPVSEGIPIAVSEGQEVRSPSIDVTLAQTTVSAGDGETIVLGGLITKSDETLRRRVPWLAEIPVLGHLFRYDFERTSRSELLIVLTPRVVRSAEDAERIKRVEAARMHWCLADVNSIHGDTGLYDLQTDVTSPTTTETIYPSPESEVIPPGPVDIPPPMAVPPASGASNESSSGTAAERLGFRDRALRRKITADSIDEEKLPSRQSEEPLPSRSAVSRTAPSQEQLDDGPLLPDRVEGAQYMRQVGGEDEGRSVDRSSSYSSEAVRR